MLGEEEATDLGQGSSKYFFASEHYKHSGIHQAFMLNSPVNSSLPAYQQILESLLAGLQVEGYFRQ